MTPELTNIYMKWQNWLAYANYYSIIADNNEGFRHLFDEAISNCESFQARFEEQMKENK